MDLIQARYGWTDDIVFALPYTRFSQLQKLLYEKYEEEGREKYRLQAFSAWLQGAGQKKTFGQFLKHLKLQPKTAKKEEMSKEDSKRQAQANIENAKRILLLDKQNRKQKGG